VRCAPYKGAAVAAATAWTTRVLGVAAAKMAAMRAQAWGEGNALLTGLDR
jgi:hypothetical protein